MAPFDPILEALCANLSPQDADDLRQERAAIFEFEAGMTRAEAELRAGLVPMVGAVDSTDTYGVPVSPSRPRTPSAGIERTLGELP